MTVAAPSARDAGRTERAQGRWQQAQYGELAWWRARSGSIDPGFYRDRAQQVRSLVGGRTAIDSTAKVLEVGSGAAGIVTHLAAGARFAIDPLERYFSSVPSWRQARDPGVWYAAARAEELPCRPRTFSLAVCDNVLDHCEDPSRALVQINRALRPGGLLYLRVSVFNAWGWSVRRAAELLRIDERHPASFTMRSLRRISAECGFRIVAVQRHGRAGLWLRQVTSGRLRQIAAAMLFVVQQPVALLLEADG